MRAEGLNIEDVSGGSTPTGEFGAKSGGLTEIRPGTYIFYDMMGVKLGVVDKDRCAAAVLVTVISTPEPGRAVIDSGSKTLSTDFTLGTPPYYFEGYASVIGNDDLILERVNEEHGMLVSRKGDTGLKIGQRLMLIPNHVCTTVNLHDHVYLKNGDTLEKTAVAARGKVY
jgi:D-serine deaminase-like pyridoxal phosphate-dependent protein